MSSTSSLARDPSSMGKDAAAAPFYDPKAKPLDHARPPWHAVAYIISLVTVCMHQCRSTIDSLDQVAVLDTFTHRVFPQYISLPMLGWTRLAIAISIWCTFVSTITSDGWIQTTVYKPGSKLQSGVKLHMKGAKTLFPFTSWCWILLGTSFTAHALLALAVAYQGEEWVLDNIVDASPWILRLVLLTWETTAPCAFLVSTVIRYVIWDKVLHGKGTSTVHLKHFRNIMSHNMNSVFVLTEIALLGGLPVRLSEMYLGPIYGSAYIWMAWSLVNFWAPKEFGPHVLYFFLDTTLGLQTTISLVALTTTLCLYYVLLSYATQGLDYVAQFLAPPEESSGLLVAHVAFVVIASSLVVRFRD